jgi:hypothetical protein
MTQVASRNAKMRDFESKLSNNFLQNINLRHSAKKRINSRNLRHTSPPAGCPKADRLLKLTAEIRKLPFQLLHFTPQLPYLRFQRPDPVGPPRV